jgi:two-component system CheB/CheR fusion protein
VVRTGPDGHAALALLDQFAPQLAILDLGLPDMDGYELAARIRERPGAMRIVALTGYGQPQDHAKSSQAGFDFHLVKPVDMSRLLDQIGAAPTT